jgi:carboxypeptidase C (cathepsin A)
LLDVVIERNCEIGKRNRLVLSRRMHENAKKLNMKLIALSVSLSTVFSQLIAPPFIELPEFVEFPETIHRGFEGGSLTFSPTSSSLCDPNVVQYTGYFDIKGTNKKYFFWFFESRSAPATDPTVAWLTGGPGCSSMLALFGENGPCTVNKDGKSTTLNPYSWTNEANMFWIDQPPGAGFSTGDADAGEEEVAVDMVAFLRAFFDALPQYNRDFYIFGESYAGHYIPAIASKLQAYNKASPAFQIDFKGVGIGNGLTAPSEQYKWYPQMAFQSGTAPQIVSESEFQMMQSAVPTCTKLIELCNQFEGQNPSCLASMLYCNIKLMKPYQDKGMNPYDMRLKCEKPPLCYDFEEIDIFLNNPSVQQQIGVRSKWESCNFQVNLQFIFDFMKDYQQLIPQLLEDNIQVLIYVGDQDFICNWIGNKHWVLDLDWSGKDGFRKASDVVYKDSHGDDIGLIRKHRNLSFLQFYKAGHMVPMDQPEKSLEMFNDFLRNRMNVDDFAPPTVETE